MDINAAMETFRRACDAIRKPTRTDDPDKTKWPDNDSKRRSTLKRARPDDGISDYDDDRQIGEMLARLRREDGLEDVDSNVEPPSSNSNPYKRQRIDRTLNLDDLNATPRKKNRTHDEPIFTSSSLTTDCRTSIVDGDHQPVKQDSINVEKVISAESMAPEADRTMSADAKSTMRLADVTFKGQRVTDPQKLKK